MNEGLDLTDIASRVGIDTQQLRYVLDQKLLPGAQSLAGSAGRGRARRFTAFEAFAIACAAFLLQAGLGRRRVSDCLNVISDYEDREDRSISRVPLFQAFQRGEVAFLEVGDGRCVRLVGSQDDRGRVLESGWRELRSGAKLPMCEPLISLRIDIGRLRKHIVGERGCT